MTRTLAIDIGGTKTLAALVEGARIIDECQTATGQHSSTDQMSSAEAWCDAVAASAQAWAGDFDWVGAAVTGVIENGRWSALNPETLPVPAGYPLANELTRRLGKPAVCFNDAQAAAWGEHRHGAGQDGAGQDGAGLGRDLVFVTVSTGIGGGVVSGGKLMVGSRGLAGSVGITRSGPSVDAPKTEDVAAGRWMAAEARKAGEPGDAAAVLTAARQGKAWAVSIVSRSADAVAALLINVQLLFDPDIVVLGGGIGLADGYLDAVRARLSGAPKNLRPDLRPATLGRHAGVVGVADLACRTYQQ